MVEIFIALLVLALMTSLMYINSLHRQIKSLTKVKDVALKSVSISEILRQELSNQVSQLQQNKEK